MNTMHELLMPELIESKYEQRLAEAASRRQVRAAIEAGRPIRSSGTEPGIHLPRLFRRPSTGTI